MTKNHKALSPLPQQTAPGYVKLTRHKDGYFRFDTVIAGSGWRQLLTSPHKGKLESRVKYLSAELERVEEPDTGWLYWRILSCPEASQEQIEKANHALRREVKDLHSQSQFKLTSWGGQRKEVHHGK